MKIKINKLHPGATIPEYATKGAGAVDLRTIEAGDVPAHGSHTFDTGLAVEIPQGFAMLLFSRSGHGFKHGVRLANAVGLIDADYRGAVKIRIHNDSHTPFSFEAGDRIAQAMIVFAPNMEFEAVDYISETERGAGGFGHTGA